MSIIRVLVYSFYLQINQRILTIGYLNKINLTESPYEEIFHTHQAAQAIQTHSLYVPL